MLYLGMENKKDLAVYILSRNDLPSLNPGKAMAQIHHAGVQMMSKYHSSPLVKEYISTGIKEGADHFNTTLVLAVPGLDIKNCIKAAKKIKNVECGIVVDPSYPFIMDNDELIDLMPSVTIVANYKDGKVLMVRKEFTCAWFLGDRTRADFRDLFLGFPLHP